MGRIKDLAKMKLRNKGKERMTMNNFNNNNLIVNALLFSPIGGVRGGHYMTTIILTMLSKSINNSGLESQNSSPAGRLGGTL